MCRQLGLCDSTCYNSILHLNSEALILNYIAALLQGRYYYYSVESVNTLYIP